MRNPFQILISRSAIRVTHQKFILEREDCSGRGTDALCEYFHRNNWPNLELTGKASLPLLLILSDFSKDSIKLTDECELFSLGRRAICQLCKGVMQISGKF